MYVFIALFNTVLANVYVPTPPVPVPLYNIWLTTPLITKDWFGPTLPDTTPFAGTVRVVPFAVALKTEAILEPVRVERNKL